MQAIETVYALIQRVRTDEKPRGDRAVYSPALSVTLVTAVAACPMYGQSSPIQPGEFQSHPASADPTVVLTFKPLAPERSEYWKDGFPATGNVTGYPLPPLPLGTPIYSMFGDSNLDFMGSTISTDPLFWKGVDIDDGTWQLYTTITTDYDQSAGDTNWHNQFQSALTDLSCMPNHLVCPTYPPAWPTSGEAAINFTDWVDLYAPYLSRAFFDDYGGNEGANSVNEGDVTPGFGRFGFPRIGAPQHVDLPPTYPPQSLDAWSSSSPLVPASGASSIGAYSTRQTVAGRLDLVTGEPLLQEIDLELEFGSAVYRRIRTYSERADHGIKTDNDRQYSTDIESWTRGWHGAGWMSNDMPLFYFDASQAGTITTGQPHQIGPVCYFVPDTHHSIPFIQQDTSTSGTNSPPDYVAPEWFDAVLLYDKSDCEWGDVDPDPSVIKMGWISPPKEMKVYLHDRSVVYTIKMYYEDVDPIQHLRPQIQANGEYSSQTFTYYTYTYGVPYYGLVTSIEDKVGNRIAINHAGPDKHRPYWDPNPLARQEGADLHAIPVRQRGWFKGMIDHVKLYPAGDDEAAWTIFYTYRTFFAERNRDQTFFRSYNSDELREFVDYFDSLSHPPALHSLLVYDRDIDESEIPASRELILPCDSETYGPAEHAAHTATPPVFIDLRVRRSAHDEDGDGVRDIDRVFGVPATGGQNNQFDYQDIEIGATGEGDTLTVLPPDWAHQLRFSYAEPAFYGEFDPTDNQQSGEFSPFQDFTLRSCGPVKITDTYSVEHRARAAYLLKSARISRAESDTSTMQNLPPRFWLYRYQDIEGPMSDAPDPYPSSPYSGNSYWTYGTLAQAMPRRLSHRYGPETIDRIYANRPAESASCDINAFVNALIGIDEDRYVEGSLCYMEPPEPPDGPTPSTEPGGVFGYGDGSDAGPYTDPDGTGGGTITSSTHSLEEAEINYLPIGLLADTIYYRWSEPYRLDPRLLSTPAATLGDPELIARPASWALYDGRFGGSMFASEFNLDLRNKYVGGSVSLPCEDLLDLTITQANEQTTGFLPGGTGLYSVIGDDGSTKWYRIYRFITAPDEPTAWRGHRYNEQGRNVNVPLGPEVIWHMQHESDSHHGDHPSDIPNNATATHGIYYYPFNFVAEEWGASIDDAEVVALPPSVPMWWTVVDEYNSIEDALSANSSMAYPEADVSNFKYAEYSSQTPWTNRRVVGMSNTGAVLSDRIWTNNEGTAASDDPPAVLEAWSYDEYLRPVLKFSRGWGAAAASNAIDETATGLVEAFAYADPFEVNMGSPGHNAPDVIIELAPRTPLNKWIRKGCAGTDIAVSSIEYYDDPDGGGSRAKEWRAKLPKIETFYDLLGNTVGTIEHSYGHWDLSELPADSETAQPPMRWKVRAGPEHRRSPGGPLVRAIDGQWYNNKGQLVWSVSGAMADPIPDAQGYLSVEPADEIFLDYYQYDEDGRQMLMVEDIGLGSTGQGFTEEHLVYPGHPTDADYAGGSNPTQPYWQRMGFVPKGTLFVGGDVPADDLTVSELSAILSQIAIDQSTLIGTSMYRQAQADPLNLVTFRDHNRFGEFKVVHPNGLRDIVHYEVDSAYLRELRAMGVDYEDGAWRFAGQGLYDSQFAGHSFSEGIMATIAELEAGQWSGAPYDLDTGVFADQRLEVMSEIEPNYDTAGRLVGLTIADGTEGVTPLTSATSYDGWGNPLLEVSPDRLIKRYRYDGLGRLHKTYLGSKDGHHRWRVADNEDDDMVLTEKLFYGTTPTDAFRPVTKWTYRERSTSQYDVGEWFEPSDGQHGGMPAFSAGNSGDGRSSPGRVERYEYDWRMRKVSTTFADFEIDNPAVYREERVFLDNLDRVRFTAVYAPEATASAPSPDIAPGSDLPAATSFLGAGPGDNLLSLEETVYNGAGQVVERRRYDPAGTGGYLVTHSYTDHADRPLWSSSAGGRVSKNVYDAKGRVVWTSEFAGDGPGAIELSRSVNEYGPDGRVEAVRFYERSGQTGGADIQSAPHRLSVTYTWYDSAGRVIATADMGTATHDGTGYDRMIPDRVDDSPEVLATIDEYLGDGGSSRTRRMLVGIEIPDAYFDAVTGEAIARISCMWYDRLGKQNAMLSVHSASKDISTGEIAIDFIIDRTEHNRYGQKVLEHKYQYIGDGQSYTHADFELLGGMEYSFEADVVLPNDPTPRRVVTTQVREITPLIPDSSVMTIVWSGQQESEITDPDTGEPKLVITGRGALAAEWHDPTARRSTILEYGAPVIEPNYDLPSYVLHPDGPIQFPIDSNDWGHLGISTRPDLIKAVHLPDPDGGGTGDGLGYSLFFFYHADGLPAIRVDSRGIGIRYIYDTDGNVVRLSSDDSNMPLVSDLGMTDDQLPSNAIEYTYDALSRLTGVTTGRDYVDGTTFRVDTASTIDYDSLGNMLSEEQLRYERVMNSGTLEPEDVVFAGGTVGYAWDTRLRMSSADPVDQTNNVSRLLSMTYPARVGTHDGGAHLPRVVTLGYGPAGSISDLLNRVESLTSTGGPSGRELGHVATYRYDGLSRLKGLDLGDVPNQPSATFVQTDDRQFDLFGRVIDREVKSFDLGTGSHLTAMRSVFGYDLRGQRVFERLRQRDVNSITPRDNTHSAFYQYDALGRLIGEHYGTLKSNGFEGLDHAAGPAVPVALTYGLDELNRRVGTTSAPGLSIWNDADKDGQVDVGEVSTQTQEIDERGALTGIDDGSAVEPVGRDLSGAITQLHGREIYHDWLGRPVLVLDAAGDPVFAVRYDGFGRVAQRRAPWPTLSGELRVETYFYDGVRRIQEVFTDPVAAIPPWPQPFGGGGGSGGGGANPETRTEAEYIWSAASGQPFDTCHVQVDWWDREAWYIQDHHSGTVRAYTDPSGEVAEQYSFDAFGNLLRRDQFRLVKTGSQGFYRTFRQRLGHQGLFAERADSLTNARSLDVGVELWYQSRSRWYLPELGRFGTPDPNATGIPVTPSLAMLGTVPTGPPTGNFKWESHYGDGWDTYAAYGANPVYTQDPTGLFFFVDTLTGQLSRSAGKAYGVYDKLDPAIGLAQNLMSGIGMQQAMLMMAADYVFDKSGGKVFEQAIDGFSKASKAVRNGSARKSVYRGTDLFPDVVGKIAPYRDAKKLTAGHRGAIQAHHIVEKRFAKALGIRDTDGIPAVVLTREQHQEITNRLINEIGYGHGVGQTHTATKDAIRAMYLRAYADYPELLAEAMKVVK